jgi:hypothetical protein
MNVSWSAVVVHFIHIAFENLQIYTETNLLVNPLIWDRPFILSYQKYIKPGQAALQYVFLKSHTHHYIAFEI